MAEKNEEIKATHAVLYTDGGCMPPRGPGGWGIHGYTFTLEAPKQGSGCPKANPEAGGYEMKAAGKPSITVVEYVDFFGTLPDGSTNNIAELMAAIEAFTFVRNHGLKAVTMHLDSQYVLKGMTEWHKGWESRGWMRPDGNEVPNRKLWEQLLALKREVEDAGVKTRYNWVKGHSGNLGNVLADSLATRAVSASMNNVVLNVRDLTPAKGYWNRDNDRNRLIYQAGWLFNTHISTENASKDGRTIYYTCDLQEKIEYHGKPIANSCYSVMFLKHTDPVMELVRTYQNQVDRSTANSLMFGKLKHILHKDVYADILEYGDTFMTRGNQRRLDISLVGGVYQIRQDDDKNSKSTNTARHLPLTEELNPPRMAFRALEVLGTLESILEATLERKEGMVYTDITDLLYVSTPGKSASKTKLLPEVSSSMKSFEAMVGFDTDTHRGQAKLCLTLGQDIAVRNTLSAIAELSPKITIVTWKESGQAFRFATVVETVDDAAIYSSPYSNLVLLPR